MCSLNKLNKSAFTLIELIFVILIIGILAAVAIPKFTNLKQNAEVASVIKVASDAYASIPAAYLNMVDLSEDKNDSNATDTNNPVTLGDLVDITGNDWNLTGNTAIYNDGSGDVVTLTLGEDRNVSLHINCANFSDPKTQANCVKKTNASGVLDLNTSF